MRPREDGRTGDLVRIEAEGSRQTHKLPNVVTDSSPMQNAATMRRERFKIFVGQPTFYFAICYWEECNIVNTYCVLNIHRALLLVPAVPLCSIEQLHCIVTFH